MTLSPMLDANTQPRIHTPQRDTGPAHDQARTPSGNRDTGTRWHVCYTNPQAERRAADNLHQQGYTAYLPLMIVRRRDPIVRSLLHPVQIPLFSRYCFVRFDPTRDPWQPIISTLGVRNLLRRADGIPEPCPDAAISALQAAEALAATQPPDSSQWRPGTPCSLPRGYAFGGLPAVILDVAGDTARICIMFLGQLRTVSVNATCLVARDE